MKLKTTVFLIFECYICLPLHCLDDQMSETFSNHKILTTLHSTTYSTSTAWPKRTPNTSISLPTLYNWLDLQMMASFDPMPKRRSSLSFFKTSTALLCCRLACEGGKGSFFRHWPFNAILVWHILITQHIPKCHPVNICDSCLGCLRAFTPSFA